MSGLYFNSHKIYSGGDCSITLSSFNAVTLLYR